MPTAIERFFADRPRAFGLYRRVKRLLTSLGDVTIRVTKSQIAFRRARAFAWVWTPDRYLTGKTAPLVLSLSLPRRDRSRRWKQIVHATPKRWMHHLELRTAGELDAKVRTWLREAWEEAA